ncbi:MAG: hypothetical protein M3509_13945, partial [Chloroflexota bacterium]|nr:hypothetical protein [Chloroflexota bacterium]
MTIALSIKVNDGLVFAADSASTMAIVDTSGNVSGVAAVYNNANKVFNLRKGLPIGAMTWGLGSIGVESIETLVKDLRVELTEDGTSAQTLPIDRHAYTIQEVASRLFSFIYEDRYKPLYPDRTKLNPAMGFIVGGYSAGRRRAEEFRLEIDEVGNCNGPVEIYPGEVGAITWHGEPEAIFRLIPGFGTRLPEVLEHSLGVPAHQIPQVINVLINELSAPIFNAAMPIQDAI